MLSERVVDVVIVGAGISGLATAHCLTQKHLRVCLLEKQAQPGGVIRSQQKDGFLVELGPHSILETSPLIGAFMGELGLGNAVEYAHPQAKNRYIVRAGKLHALPLGPLALIRTGLFSTQAIARILWEPFIPPAPADQDESLADFVSRRLGREFLDYAIDPFVAGVYAGVPEKLSVRSAFPKLYALEQEYGSLIKGALLGKRKREKTGETPKFKARMFSFGQGMETLIRTLAHRLRDNLHTAVDLQSIAQTDSGYAVQFVQDETVHHVQSRALVLAIPAYMYSNLPIEFDFSVRSTLAEIFYPPVAVVYFGFAKPPTARPLDGFGFLVPRREKRAILGTLWSSSIFSARAPQGGVALTTFVGGSRAPEYALLDKASLQELVQRELQDLLGIAAQPDLVVIQQWARAIPQYEPGHAQRLQVLADFENRHPGFYFSGNFCRGISAADCIAQAYTTTDRVVSYLQEFPSHV